ncbi:MAG: TonB-dependent receptor plug domain-containing protein [Terracidiphilus sp.]|jgi:iron complex outermembrane receptor protein/vitamin B12 transporter
MFVAALRGLRSRAFLRIFVVILVAACAALCPAASIRGVVTDASGAKVTGATVTLLSNGKPVATAVSTADGSFQILTGSTGRFFLVVSAKSLRQVDTPMFYAGPLDNIEKNVVMEPEWVRESIVVTATGTPTPQAQTSAATSVLGPLDLDLRDDFVSTLRLMPGTFVVQAGQRGAEATLFVRGGDSDDNKVLVDGVSAGDLGGQFDFGTLATTAVERVEVYRGPDSDLYGADAESSVVSFTTPHGTTSFPSLLFNGDAGNFQTSHEDLEVAGAHNKLDYLGAFSWFQTVNDLPNDEYHVATLAGNVGWAPSGTTQIRGTVHYGVDATGVPNAWDFYHVADQATEKDQNIFASGSIDNQTTASFHQSVRYGLTRKREQYNLWQQSGDGTFDAYGDSFGAPVTITGANGYQVSGQALLDYASYASPPYPEGHQLVSNRDQLIYEGDYSFTPHVTGMAGFHYEDERGADPKGSEPAVEWRNYDYLASVHGDFKNRVFYTLGGSLQRYSSFGTQTSPRAGVTGYVLRPRSGIFSGTRLLFNFGEAVREPALTDQFYSLYTFLQNNDGQSTISELHITPLSAPQDRTYEGGVEQTFFSERLLFRTSFFHNEFGRQIEYVGLNLVPQLLPGLTPIQQNALEQTLQADGAYELSINSEAFRAMGVETTVEGGIGKNIFMRGGYTYLDAVVQRSFTNDDVDLLGPVPTFNGIPVGADSPLQGARPFRRPPHTGFVSASYSANRITGVLTTAFASRSDDSDFLAYDDLYGGNSLLLPNRNLDHGYAKVDLGGSFGLTKWLGIYGQGENLTGNRHIAPIGYPSLQANVRLGLKLQWGFGAGQ